LLAEFYEIDEHAINIFTSQETFEETFFSRDGQQYNNVVLNVVLSELNGDFPLWIDLYCFRTMQDEDIAKFFVQNAGVDVIIGDDSVNPYQWILFARNNKFLIYVNVEFLDEEDGFLIDRIKLEL